MAFTFKFVAELDYKQKDGYNGSTVNKKGTVDFEFPNTLNFKAACGAVTRFDMEDLRTLVANFDKEKAKWTPPVEKKKVTVKKKTEVKKK